MSKPELDFGKLKTDLSLIAAKKMNKKADLLDDFRVDQAVADRMKARDIYEDAPRNTFDIPSHDSTGPAMIAASFANKQIRKANIPVLSMRYESMDVQKWAEGRDNVSEGVAKFAVDILDGLGMKRCFSLPILFVEGEMKEPEYFVDSIGRKYAFTRDGFDDYLDEAAPDEGIAENQSEDTVGRKEGEEPALADWRMLLVKEAADADGQADQLYVNYHPRIKEKYDKGDLVGAGKFATDYIVKSKYYGVLNTDKIIKRITSEFPNLANSGYFDVGSLSAKASSKPGILKKADVNAFKNFAEKFLIESGVELDEETKLSLSNENTNYDMVKGIIMQFLGDGNEYSEMLEGYVRWATLSSMSKIITASESMEEAVSGLVDNIENGNFVEGTPEFATFEGLLSKKYGCASKDVSDAIKIQAQMKDSSIKTASKKTFASPLEQMKIYGRAAKVIHQWAKDEKKTEEDKEMVVELEGDVVVTDKSGNEIVRFRAEDLSKEDLDAIKQDDIEGLAKKLEKLKDLGLIMETTPDIGDEEMMDFGIDNEMIAPAEVESEMPAVDELPEEEEVIDMGEEENLPPMDGEDELGGGDELPPEEEEEEPLPNV